MFGKLKVIATISKEVAERKEVEPVKTIKLQVAGGTTVRKLVAKAFNAVDLNASLWECRGVQYSSNKFSKFIDIDLDQKVKDGREYMIRVIEAVTAIQEIDIEESAKEVGVVIKELDHITCKTAEDTDDEYSSICFGDSAIKHISKPNENSAELNERPAELNERPAELSEGPAELSEGPAELSEGPAELSEGPAIVAQVIVMSQTEDIEASKKEESVVVDHGTLSVEQVVLVSGKSEPEQNEDSNPEEIALPSPSNVTPVSSSKNKIFSWFSSPANPSPKN